MTRLPIIVLLSLSCWSCTVLSEKDEYGIRGMKNIQDVFESHKVSIFAIYKKSLSKKPGLVGEINFLVYIQESGKVTNCRSKTNTIEIDSLAGNLCNYILNMSFGVGDEFELSYFMRFFPSELRTVKKSKY